MKAKVKAAPVRALPEEVANKIAAGEVVERPASVVKELVENALDAGATRIAVRLVAAGRRLIEVQDNGHGMSEQDALLAVERHTTSKIRTSEDLDNILTYGFRGEALASIASVSRFELVTRRERDEAATRLRIEGAVLRDVSQAAAPVGTRISVNRLYFNTPVRAKFLKGITTELGRCIDTVQRFALVAPGVAFQLEHNDKSLLDIPANALIRDRIALIWGLGFLNDLIELDTELGGMRFRGFIGTPQLSRSSRSHQFFFMNARPVINRALQYGFEEGYHQLLTVGRRPVGILLVEAPPRSVDINIHPAKREIRFRDERAARKAMSDAVRQRLAELRESRRPVMPPSAEPATELPAQAEPWPTHPPRHDAQDSPFRPPAPQPPPDPAPTGVQTEFVASRREAREREDFEPTAVYHTVDELGAPIQVFDSYLMVPEEDRLLIIDQHALHERLTYDGLRAELADGDYESQQLMVPLVIDVPPAYVKIIESNLGLFSKLGIEVEPFGGNTFQVTALCHLFEESKISDAVSGVLDQLAQGDLFNEEQFLDDMLRLVVAACRGSVKAGDRLSSEERASLLDGFRRLRPPYTCPHGRPIITELTLAQMEKSFRRRQ